MEKISVLFWRRNHKDPARKTSIICRIIVDGERTEFSTNVKANNTTWSQDKQRLKGTSDEAHIANKTLALLKNQIDEIYYNLRKTEAHITGSIIKYELGGGSKKDTQYTILSLYKEDVESYKIDSTKRNKSSLMNVMEEFLKEEFSVKDLFIYKVDYAFLKKFEKWGLTKKGWEVGTMHVHLDMLRKSILRCLNEGIITKDPFSKYKLKRAKAKERGLDPKDIEKIFTAEFSFEPFQDPVRSSLKHTPESTDLTRKIFLFLSFVGAAWVDGRGLSENNLVYDEEHGLALSFERQKTKVKAFVPLLDYPRQLLEELRVHPKAVRNGKLLPMECLDVYNKRLHVIERYCGIEKEITSHVARHIAATFYLNAGIPIHIISKALGVSEEELKKTYARLRTDTVSKEFNLLNDRMK